MPTKPWVAVDLADVEWFIRECCIGCRHAGERPDCEVLPKLFKLEKAEVTVDEDGYVECQKWEDAECER